MLFFWATDEDAGRKLCSCDWPFSRQLKGKEDSEVLLLFGSLGPRKSMEVNQNFFSTLPQSEAILFPTSLKNTSYKAILPYPVNDFPIISRWKAPKAEKNEKNTSERPLWWRLDFAPGAAAAYQSWAEAACPGRYACERSSKLKGKQLYSCGLDLCEDHIGLRERSTGGQCI